MAPLSVRPAGSGPKKMAGKVVLVTGANVGIGAEVSRTLAKEGAAVILACRRTQAAEATAQSIRDELGPDVSVDVGPQLDLSDPASVKAFATAFMKQHRRLDVLVNNAGMGQMAEEFTPEGVGIQAQINYLGPYHLTRLLEGLLASTAAETGHARIVNVSSVTHRYAYIQSADDFLRVWKRGQYAHTKLANVLFAFEAQRRYARLGVRSCAVDPGPAAFFATGAVKSDLWRKQAVSSLRSGPLTWLINALYAPPHDGCAAVVHAATVPWEQDRQLAAQTDRDDLRFYARGWFASPLVTTAPEGGGKGPMRTVAALGALFASFVDYPTRFLTGGLLGSKTCVVPPNRCALDEERSRELWDVSANLLKLPLYPKGVPAEPHVTISSGRAKLE